MRTPAVATAYAERQAILHIVRRAVRLLGRGHHADLVIGTEGLVIRGLRDEGGDRPPSVNILTAHSATSGARRAVGLRLGDLATALKLYRAKRLSLATRGASLTIHPLAPDHADPAGETTLAGQTTHIRIGDRWDRPVTRVGYWAWPTVRETLTAAAEIATNSDRELYRYVFLADIGGRMRIAATDTWRALITEPDTTGIGCALVYGPALKRAIQAIGPEVESVRVARSPIRLWLSTRDGLLVGLPTLMPLRDQPLP